MKKKQENEIVKGYKAFDQDLKCKGFQFELGKTYNHTEEVKVCQSGYHLCEYPLDVFSFYPPMSRFAEAEGSGKIEKHDDDTKVACSTIHIGAEINLSAFIQAAVKFVFSRAKWTKKKSATGYSGAASATGVRGAASATGVRGAASATGVRGAASATGDSGAASATGDSGAASATGNESVAVSLGIDAKAKASLNAWIVLSEWKQKEGLWHRVDTKSIQVDDKAIKADVWYMLKDGKFREVKT